MTSARVWAATPGASVVMVLVWTALMATLVVAETLPKAQPIHISPVRRPILIQGDAGRLGQVFVNLLANAVEHAAASPTIDVTVRRSGSVAVVEVCDHGPGIASNVLPQLFQPYTRLGQKPSAGLGLGLYLAREIVTAHATGKARSAAKADS